MEKNESRHMFIASDFRTRLLGDVQERLKSRDISYVKICVVRRVRDLQDGDYCVPKGCIPKITNKVLDEICAELKESNRNSYLKISRATTSQHFGITFYLERPLTLKSTLVPYWQRSILQTSFGDVGKGTHVLVTERHSKKDGALENLRSSVILEHVTCLLKEAGYDVETVRCFQPSSDLLDISVPSIEWTDQMCVDCKKLVIDQVTSNKYCTQMHHVPCKQAKLDSCSTSVESSEMDRKTGQNQTKVVLSLQQFVQDKGLPVGKDGFDKNLKFSELNYGEVISDTMKEAYLLHTAVANKLQKDRTGVVVHVTPDTECFSQQRVTLTTRVIWPGDPFHRQVYLVHGSVKSRRQTKSQVQSAADFVQLRFSQMKSAALMKYGEEVNGPGWQATITALTSAGIKFEMLSTVSRSAVKLDLSEGDDGNDNRTGSFVMYNCARLTTLFKHFEEAVSQGQYPPLPNIEDVDFSLLREEDEWTLFFLYVFPYPDLIRETVEELVPKSASISTKIHTHKVCNLLINFSHSLSSYYSRTHILGENRPHLLPLMYARLYFLKIVLKVLSHALSLLGIEPMSQL